MKAAWTAGLPARRRAADRVSGYRAPQRAAAWETSASVQVSRNTRRRKYAIKGAGASDTGGGGCAIRSTIRGRINATHLRFDPRLDARVHFIGREPLRLDRLADRHFDYTRIFEKRVARPHASRVVCDRHDRRTGPYRETRTTGFVFALLPRWRAGAFRKHDDPGAFGHARLALLDDRLERVLAVLAVDLDHLQHAE